MKESTPTILLIIFVMALGFALGGYVFRDVHSKVLLTPDLTIKTTNGISDTTYTYHLPR